MGVEITKFGKFKLIKKIARGGMADIFIGFSGSLSHAAKFIVIKRILLSQSHNKELTKMFQNEGKMTMNLQHSNIGHIYEFGIENDQYFICMEYISGRNLRQFIQKLQSIKKNINVAICAYIIRCVCDGLDYAHNSINRLTGESLDIIHRDISPQNIMVSFDGSIKIIDFGIAKTVDSEVTRVGTLKGKFAYMSPEQSRGKLLDRQSDVFSVGVVLWELLAGQKLFKGTNELQILKKISEGHVTNLESVNPNIQKELVDIVHKSLSINKNIRYKTAADMSNALSVFLSTFYPHVTSSFFASYLKKVYVNEMLEEQRVLKKYSGALLAYNNGGSKNIFSRYINKEKPVQKSTFIGYQEKLTKQEDKEATDLTDNKKYDTATIIKTSDFEPVSDTLISTQSGTNLSVVNSITKTEFPDTLHNTQFSNYTKTKYRDSKIDHYDNSIKSVDQELQDVNTNIDSTHFTVSNNHTNSYSENIKSSYINRYKKKKKMLSFFVNLLVIGICGVGYYYRVLIADHSIVFVKKFLQTNTVSSVVAKNTNKPPLSSIVRGPLSVDEGVVNKKNIFINTYPSGANIYIDNKKINHLTPTVIEVPLHQVKLVLSKIGYYNKEIILTPQINHKGLKITLIKKSNTENNNSPVYVQ